MRRIGHDQRDGSYGGGFAVPAELRSIDAIVRP
jgi:hypothetical protein